MSFLTRRSGSGTTPPPSGFSLLDANVVLTGDLSTAGSLRIDGRVDGTVREANVVVLGAGASMTGDIHAREVVIGGTLAGTIHASERVELQATAVVTGDIVTQSVLVQEGGVVNGRVLMRPPEAAGTAGTGREASRASTDAGEQPARRQGP